MENQNKTAVGNEILRLFPKLRRLVFGAFDAGELHVTRTQQMILTVMSNGETYSMSELAALIGTSNEQATRAVSQLVNMGCIDRSQNEINHRIVNIRLTDDAMTALSGISGSIEDRISSGGGTAAAEDKEARICELMKELNELLDERNI